MRHNLDIRGYIQDGKGSSSVIVGVMIFANDAVNRTAFCETFPLRIEGGPIELAWTTSCLLPGSVRPGQGSLIVVCDGRSAGVLYGLMVDLIPSIIRNADPEMSPTKRSRVAKNAVLSLSNDAIVACYAGGLPLSRRIGAIDSWRDRMGFTNGMLFFDVDILGISSLSTSCPCMQ
jgi:hypothetical protein